MGRTHIPFSMMENWKNVAVLVVAYLVASLTNAVNAEACNTTTLTALQTVTEIVPLSGGPLTVTVTHEIAGFNTTHVSVASHTGTSTVTEIITVTNEIGLPSSSVVGSDSTTTLTSTALTTSYVNSTVVFTTVSDTSTLTRASVPESLSLTFTPITTFPIISARPHCEVGQICNLNTGASIPVPTVSTSNLTSTFTVISTAVLGAGTAVISAPVVQTSRAPFVNGTSTAYTGATTTTFGTVTLSSNGLKANTGSYTSTKTVVVVVTVFPINSVLSAVTSLLSEAASELATLTSSTKRYTSTTTVITTVDETVPAPTPAASSAFTSTETVVSTAIRTSVRLVQTLTETMPKFLNTTSTTTIFSTAVTIDHLNTSTTVATEEATIVVLPTDTASSGIPVASLNDRTTTFSIPTVSAKTSKTSASTAFPLFNPSLTGAASSLRVPGIFSMLMRLLVVLDITKKTSVAAEEAVLVGSWANHSASPTTRNSPPHGTWHRMSDHAATISTHLYARAHADASSSTKSGMPVVIITWPSGMTPPTDTDEATSTPALSATAVSPASAPVSMSVRISTTTEPCPSTSAARSASSINSTTDVTVALTTTTTSTIYSTLTTSLANATHPRPLTNESTAVTFTLPPLTTRASSSNISLSVLATSLHASTSSEASVNTTTWTSTLASTMTSFDRTVTSTMNSTMTGLPRPTSAVGKLGVKTLSALLLVGVGAWFVL